MNNLKLTTAQREALSEAVEIAWWHFGHHRECYPAEGCDCGADELKQRLAGFFNQERAPSQDAAVIRLLRALPDYVGHSWNCPESFCGGCHYPRLVEVGALFGISFVEKSWSAWWCDQCQRFFHSRPTAPGGSCSNSTRCVAYKSVIRGIKIQAPGVPF